MYDVLHNYLASIERVESTGRVVAASMLSDVFEIAAANLGFRFFSYHVYCPKEAPHKLVNHPSALSNLPSSGLLNAQWQGYFLDPTVLGVLREIRHPFLWSHVAGERFLDRPGSTWFEDARATGIDDAVVTAFPGIGGEIAVMTMFFVRASAMDELIQLRLSVLFLMVNHFHHHARAALLERESIEGSRRRSTLLSPRESEVLEWAAKGKSTSEIAVILCLSGKSVDFHMEGCKRKLNVFNRTHAVAKAILLGLLKFEPRSGQLISHWPQVPRQDVGRPCPVAALTKCVPII